MFNRVLGGGSLMNIKSSIVVRDGLVTIKSSYAGTDKVIDSSEVFRGKGAWTISDVLEMQNTALKGLLERVVKNG